MFHTWYWLLWVLTGNHWLFQNEQAFLPSWRTKRPASDFTRVDAQNCRNTLVHFSWMPWQRQWTTWKQDEYHTTKCLCFVPSCRSEHNLLSCRAYSRCDFPSLFTSDSIQSCKLYLVWCHYTPSTVLPCFQCLLYY